jgi:hypothetical protein
MTWPSVYVLECSVQPGGSRWAELHTYTTPGPILRVLDRLCANEHGFFAYHTLWYGAVVGLWTIHHGEVVDFTDLHPYLSVDLREHGVIRLDQRESQAALDFNDEAEAAGDLDRYAWLRMELDERAVRRLLPPSARAAFAARRAADPAAARLRARGERAVERALVGRDGSGVWRAGG